MTRWKCILNNVTTYLPLFSARIKNEWGCASLSPVCLCGMDREDFTFLHIVFLIRRWGQHWVERPHCQFHQL